MIPNRCEPAAVGRPVPTRGAFPKRQKAQTRHRQASRRFGFDSQTITLPGTPTQIGTTNQDAIKANTEGVYHSTRGVHRGKRGVFTRVRILMQTYPPPQRGLKPAPTPHAVYTRKHPRLHLSPPHRSSQSPHTRNPGTRPARPPAPPLDHRPPKRPPSTTSALAAPPPSPPSATEPPHNPGPVPRRNPQVRTPLHRRTREHPVACLPLDTPLHPAGAGSPGPPATGCSRATLPSSQPARLGGTGYHPSHGRELASGWQDAVRQVRRGLPNGWRPR